MEKGDKRMEAKTENELRQGYLTNDEIRLLKIIKKRN